MRQYYNIKTFLMWFSIKENLIYRNQNFYIVFLFILTDVKSEILTELSVVPQIWLSPLEYLRPCISLILYSIYTSFSFIKWYAIFIFYVKYCFTFFNTMSYKTIIINAFIQSHLNLELKKQCFVYSGRVIDLLVPLAT